MFNRREYAVFGVSIVIIVVAYALMAADTQPNGFGVLTLWIAPPMLLLGFALPVAAIAGIDDVRKWRIRIKTAKHVIGLAVWVIALITYSLTLEPTASLWDCSEFI